MSDASRRPHDAANDSLPPSKVRRSATIAADGGDGMLDHLTCDINSAAARGDVSDDDLESSFGDDAAALYFQVLGQAEVEVRSKATAAEAPA